MRFITGSFILAAILFGRATLFAQTDSFALRPADTVVFYGDSITEQRLYTMVTELYTVTRYPKLNVKFVHSGWGGDRVTGGGGGPVDLRLQRDVLEYHPTVMTIMLGMNDGNYANHKPENDEVFYAGFRHIVESVRKTAPSVRITAIEPSPFDDVTRPFTLQPNGYNAVLRKFGQWIEHYATEAHFDVADFNTPVVEVLKKAYATDPAVAQKIVPDRVHPSLAGHMIMAEQLLKAWHARPLVSSVAIDAASGTIDNVEFAHVSNLKKGHLSWTETDEALPLPIAAWLTTDYDHAIALALQSSDFIQALNQQRLRVTGLATGRYQLSIDGAAVGTWTGQELAEGVNLAVLDTPMARQATEVRDLTIRRIDVHQERWRSLEVPLETFHLGSMEQSLKGLDALDAEIAARQHAAAQPRPHSYKLVLVK